MTSISSEYEQFTQKVMASLVGAPVHHQRVYTGRISQRKIKIDVSFNLTVAGGSNLLVLVECKCYDRKVSANKVEEFYAKIKDIGAQKGIMVTTVGFQKGAVETAKGHGIALVLLTIERQPGELVYVVHAAGPPNQMPANGGFWQGNLRGPLDNYAGGFRFENIGQFFGLLCMDSYEQERQKHVAAFEREQIKKQ